MEAETELEVMPMNAVEMMTRGEINSQVETAHRFPRSLERFKKSGIEMACIDDETAASCLYRRPVGKGDDGKQKYAEGMSIRMAEIVGASYGNLRVYAMLIEQTERQVVARGMAMDLESNFASSSEVVESTVDSRGKPYSERMRAVVAKAALAKARRDATFQVVPKALARPIEQAVRKLLHGDAKSLEKRRETIVAWIKTLGIDEKRVWRSLSIEGLADLGIDEIETLTGLRTAIKDNETTIDDAFPSEPRAAVVRAAPAQASEINYVAHLGAAIMDFVNGDKKAALGILNELTGKNQLKDLSQTDAKAAQLLFEQKYMSAGTEREPGSDDA